MRLKSRTLFIPGEFQMIHPEVGQKTPWHGSFSEIVKLEADFRAKNPALVTKNNWSLDLEDVANAVDEYNAQRMIAGGFFGFVDLEGETPSAPKAHRPVRGGSLAKRVEGVKSAMAMFRDIFGPDGKAVSKEVAEIRATSCVKCPLNQKGTLGEFFKTPIANSITGLFGLMRDKSFTTSRDDELGICEACGCVNRAKIFATGEVLSKNMAAEEIARLHPDCWIPDAIRNT